MSQKTNTPSSTNANTPTNMKIAFPSKHRNTVQPSSGAQTTKRRESQLKTDMQITRANSEKMSNLKLSCIAGLDEDSPHSTHSAEASPFRLQRLPTMSQKSRFTAHNENVFQHVDHNSKPLNYGSPSMTQDTFEFLDHFQDSDVAVMLKELFFGRAYTIEGKCKKEIDRLALEFARLIEYCLDNMLSASMLGDRLLWQTRLCNIIQQVYQAEFGDFIMKFVKDRMVTLLERFPVISENESDVQHQAGLGDLGIVVIQDAKLTTYMAKLKQDKYCKKTIKDQEFEAMNGRVSFPGELNALNEILTYAEKIQSSFEKDLRTILEKEGGDHFKYNIKGFDRAAYKMNEYAGNNKPRPAFDYLFDMIRCRAVYEDINQIKKVIQFISKRYKIVSFKDKINTPLKNVTISIVYQEIIAEIQLACGQVASEYHSHKLYEILRCLTMKEIFDVVMGWGDYNFDEFQPCNFWILPSKNLEPKSLFSMQENIPHAVLKSAEYGVVNEDQINIDCEDNPRSACWQNVQQLVCQFNDKNIQSISLTGIQVPGEYDIKKQILPYDDLVQNITGTFSNDGIKSLEFTTKKGQKILFGNTQGDKKFDMKIPKHMIVLGLFYTANATGVQSLACWFGEVPAMSKIPAIANPQDALPDIGLRCRCEHCNYQLYWEWSDEKERRCHLCRTEIHQHAGYVDCIRSSNPMCSGCYSKKSGVKELPNILKLKCPKGTLYKWRFKSIEGFKCNECDTAYNDKTGFFTNESGANKICSGCYKKKGTVQERVYYDTFPVVQVDKPCGECSNDLIWYWNAKLLGRVNDEFRCKECEESYPLTAGCYNCKACEYDVCSSCYRSSKDTIVSKMPNFLSKKCPFSHALTWQFESKTQWACNVCDLTYPKGAGCYSCPDEDCMAHKECPACYLQPYINFRYDDFNLTVLTPEQVELMVRYGKFRSAVKCEFCTGPCYWMWNTKIIPRYNHKPGYICTNHKKEVPHNFGSYHCFKCNVDVCSDCYYVEGKKALPALPNDRKQCPEGSKLEWKSNFGSGWSCSKCSSTCPGKHSGYVCPFPKCGCNGYKLCPGCYIESDQKVTGGIECDTCNGAYNWAWDLREINDDYAHGFSCTYCNRQTVKNEGGFHCNNHCKNDVCGACMEKRSEGKQIVFPNKSKCDGNNLMSWKGTSEFTWHCLWCVGKMPPEAGGFTCGNTKCKCKAAQVCSTCYGNYYNI